jgi:SAM-dependent methyltransferase
MPSYHVLAESEHELQNPTSPEKIRLLGERMRLGSESSVLDVASGRGGPALILAETLGCHIACVEKAEEFDAAARTRSRERSLDSLIEFVHADAQDFVAGREAYDAALCLGASFIWDGLPGPWPPSIPRCVAVGSSPSASPTGGSGRFPRGPNWTRVRTSSRSPTPSSASERQDWNR